MSATQLNPARLRIRRGLIGVTLVIVLIVFVSVLLEQHHTSRRGWHAILGEPNGILAVVVASAIVLALGLAFRFGLAAGIVAGVITTVGSILLAGSLGMVHLFSDVERNWHGDNALLGCIPLFGLGIAIFVGELALRSGQKFDDQSPDLPKARLVG